METGLLTLTTGVDVGGALFRALWQMIYCVVVLVASSEKKKGKALFFLYFYFYFINRARRETVGSAIESVHHARRQRAV